MRYPGIISTSLSEISFSIINAGIEIPTKNSLDKVNNIANPFSIGAHKKLR